MSLCVSVNNLPTGRRASVMTEARVSVSVSVNNLPTGRRASVMTEARESACECEQLAYGPSRVRDDRGTCVCV